MLVLPRRKNESVVIGDVVVTVVEIRGDTVRLGVVRPRDMPVRRPEDGMSRREWLVCTDPAAMLRLLRDRGLVTERKALLFGAACCRRLWELLPEEGRRVVEAVERQADGPAGREEVDDACGPFLAVVGDASGAGFHARVAVSYLLADARTDPAGYALDLSPWAAQACDDQAVELSVQAGIVRCLAGSPPFTPPAIRPEWLAFADGVVPGLACGIAEEGAFDRMPILADALEEAGCTDAEVLGHLRGPGPHHRGCHVLDGLAGIGGTP
jgi:hypothetical protein